MAYGVQERLANGDGRKLRDLLPNQATDHRIAAHLLVDRPIGGLDQLGQGPLQLASIAKYVTGLQRSLVACEIDPEASTIALGVLAEHEDRREPRAAILADEPRSRAAWAALTRCFLRRR